MDFNHPLSIHQAATENEGPFRVSITAGLWTAMRQLQDSDEKNEISNNPDDRNVLFVFHCSKSSQYHVTQIRSNASQD